MKQVFHLKTKPLNVWARMKCWPDLKLIKLNNFSMFNRHFCYAEARASSRLGVVAFTNDEPAALAIYHMFDNTRVDFQVCVKEKHRRKGLATRLLRYVSLLHRTMDVIVYPHDDTSSHFYIANGLSHDDYQCYSRVLSAAKIITSTSKNVNKSRNGVS